MKTLIPAILLCVFLAACNIAAPEPPSALDPGDPDAILPDLAKAHQDKIDFAWYAASFLRSVDPAVKAFAQQMDTDQKRLLARLTDWAKKHHVSLKYTYAPGIRGEALKGMEKLEGDLIQSDNNPNFQRDYLILTWTDLDNQRTLLTATLAQTEDPDLKAYLQDSLNTQSKESETCRALLAKYKWQSRISLSALGF